MANFNSSTAWWRLLWRRIEPLLVLNDTKRPWGFLAIAALCVGANGDSALAVADTNSLILTRLIDIMLGSLIGYVGGWGDLSPAIFPPPGVLVGEAGGG